MSAISILGCGWLGFPLAKALVGLGNAVRGATTSDSKIACLKAAGVQPYLFSVQPGQSGYPASFFEADLLVVTLPFRRFFVPPSLYLDQMVSLFPFILNAGIARVIFCSSTLVYPNLRQTVSESDMLIPDSKRARVLLDCEQLFLSCPSFKTTVIRLGGLYGPDREPVGFHTASKPIQGGESPVNMIHLDDAVGILLKIIEKNPPVSIVNAVAPEHPLRREMYQKRASALGLPAPLFDPVQLEKPFKRVVSNRAADLLAYVFRHPDPSAL